MPPPPPPGTLGKPTPAQVFDVEIKRTKSGGHLRFMEIPREEIWYNRSARNPYDALAVVHATYKTISELRDMGYGEDEINEGIGWRDPNGTPEEQARNPDGIISHDAAAEFENRPIRYCEGYPKIDVDGDGKAELRRICTIGDNFKVVKDAACNDRPFFFFTPYPLAHRIEGLSVDDLAGDLQVLDSSVARGILDSLALSLFPRTEVVEGQIEMADVLNTEIGAVIRAKQPGMMREVTHRFVGADAMPMLDWIAGIKENRTGRARGPDGINQDALQSTAPEGVQAMVGSTQERLELLARIAAETWFKPMFMLAYKLVKQYQQVPTQMKFRNKWVTVDPRSWDAESQVTVNVALGSGLVDHKLAVLQEIKNTQTLILTTFGPDNPAVGWEEIRNTLVRAAKLSGEVNPDLYFKPIDPNAPPPPPPPPNPELVTAAQKIQIEGQRVQNEAGHNQAQAQIAQQAETRAQETAAKQLELEHAKLSANIALKQQGHAVRMRQIELQHEREVQRIAQEGQLRREEMQLRAQTAESGHEHALATDAAKLAADHLIRKHEAVVGHATALSKAEIDAEAKLEAAKLKPPAPKAKE